MSSIDGKTLPIFQGLNMSCVVGPMIAQSDAPFRSLCLKYGATCAYSEMIYSSRIVHEPEYLDAYIPACDLVLQDSLGLDQKSGLIVQVCGYGCFPNRLLNFIRFPCT